MKKVMKIYNTFYYSRYNERNVLLMKMYGGFNYIGDIIRNVMINEDSNILINEDRNVLKTKSLAKGCLKYYDITQVRNDLSKVNRGDYLEIWTFYKKNPSKANLIFNLNESDPEKLLSKGEFIERYEKSFNAGTFSILEDIRSKSNRLLLEKVYNMTYQI